MYTKNFHDWNNLKLKINDFEKTPSVKERDIWWCSIGVNVGSEMDGKNELFHRPVLIIKKLSHDLCVVAPITSKEKVGSWYLSINYQNQTKTVCLHQIKVINTKRIGKHVVRLNEKDFKSVKKQLAILLGL